MKHAIRNGVLIDEKDAQVPLYLREVQQSFSVYEALRLVKGKIVRFEDHYKRLVNSADEIGLLINVEGNELKSWLETLIREDNILEATIRITAYGGECNSVFILWSKLLTYPDSYYTDGISAITYKGERFLPNCKTGNLLLNYLALEKAHKEDAFEALLVDRYDRVLEGTRSNFYAIKDNVLFTAPDELVLSGVTRILVLQAATELGLTIVFQPIGFKELKKMDELFISSTSMAALPISNLDGKKTGKGHEITLALKDRVRELELL